MAYQASDALDFERDYWQERAEAEIASARASDHPAVVRAHYLLAGYYLDRLYGQDNGEVETAEAPSWSGQGRY